MPGVDVVVVAFGRHPRPVQPRRLVVMAVRVVVAPLGPTGLVAGCDQRHPGRQQQRGEQIALLTATNRADVGIGIGFDTFGAIVRRAVVVSAVAVVFAVGLVVLGLIRH